MVTEDELVSLSKQTDRQIDRHIDRQTDRQSIDLDISLAHPWSLEVFPSFSKRDSLALKRREEKKNQVSRRMVTNSQPNNLQAFSH